MSSYSISSAKLDEKNDNTKLWPENLLILVVFSLIAFIFK